MKNVIAAILAATSLTLFGCSAGEQTAAADKQQGARPNLFFGGLNASQEAATAFYPEQTLADYLPNQTITFKNSAAPPPEHAVVVGEIVGVDPGRGYYQGDGSLGADADKATVTDFDDPRAQWKIAEVRIKVAKAYGVEPTDEITVAAFLTGVEFDKQFDDIEPLGDVVVVLDPSRGYEWDPQLKYVARGGALFGDVDQSGGIQFPALAAESDGFVGKLTSVAALDAEAKKVKPAIEVVIDPTTGQAIRTVKN